MAKANNSPTLNAKAFTEQLKLTAAKMPQDNARYFADDNKANKLLNVRMGAIFDLAKEYTQMPLAEVTKLLDSPYYEVRMGGVSIMDFQARAKKLTPEHSKALYDLYLNKHDRINNWDLVDRSAPWVVGGYLLDKPRKPLYQLARSKNTWERRTAIVATAFFLRHKDVEDTFGIAELLVHDKHELVQKAVGSWVREAGRQAPTRLYTFLDQHAATMPRVTLRYAVEKLDKQRKEHYMTLSK